MISDKTLIKFLDEKLSEADCNAFTQLVETSPDIQVRLDKLLESRYEPVERPKKKLPKSAALNSLIADFSAGLPYLLLDQPETGERCESVNNGTAHEAGSSRGTKSLKRGANKTSLPLKRIGRYRIIREINKGAFGLLFLGLDERTGKSVAIKVLRSECGKNSIAQKRFCREAKSIASVNDPNVVRLLEFIDYSEESPSCLVMEYIDGPTLEEELEKRERFAARDAAHIVRDVGRGLATAHQEGLVHRDVKPSNILLDRTTELAKLTDFGLARLVETRTHLTAENVLLGTPAYMSPEQIVSSDKVNQRSDIYALGVVLYQLLTGSPPFDGALHVTFAQILHSSPPPIRTIAPNVDLGLTLVCRKAMAKNQNNRYQSAQEMVDDLTRWLGNERVGARPVESVLGWWTHTRGEVPVIGKMIGDTFVGGYEVTTDVYRQVSRIVRFKYHLWVASYFENHGRIEELVGRLECACQILLEFIARSSRTGEPEQWCMDELTDIRRRLRNHAPEEKFQPQFEQSLFARSELPIMQPTRLSSGSLGQTCPAVKPSDGALAGRAVDGLDLKKIEADLAEREKQKEAEKVISWGVFKQMCEGTLPNNVSITPQQVERLGRATGRDETKWHNLHEVAEQVNGVTSRQVYMQCLLLFRSIGGSAAKSNGLVAEFQPWCQDGQPKVNLLVLHLLAGAGLRGDAKAIQAFWEVKSFVSVKDFVTTLKYPIERDLERSLCFLEKLSKTTTKYDTRIIRTLSAVGADPSSDSGNLLRRLKKRNKDKSDSRQ